MPTGYSGTPLAKKLGIKSGFNYLLSGQPEYYFDLFSELPENIVELAKVMEQSADFIHLFCKDLETLHNSFEKYKPALKKNGMIWISWPKKSSGIKTDIDENMIRNYILEKGLVDIKVAAIDEVWSGLKFMYRKKE